MKYTKLFTKSLREAPKDEVSVNAQLLIRGGFIHKEMAGVYTFLPLGLKVLKNIEKIVIEEMDRIGGQQMLLSSLQNKEIWEKSGRWDDKVVDVWFKSDLNAGGQVGFGPSHEEPLTTLLKKYVESYLDLPFSAYQIQTKFRNELRSKSGLMRGREFTMKDMYSFHADQKDLNEYYKEVEQAYHKVYERLGIGDITFYTVASGGMFTEGFSHEFQTLCKTGEDTIYLNRKKKIAVNKEVYNDKTLQELGLNKDDMEEVVASEVGNIFKLGNKYSKPLELKFTDKDGNQKEVMMGCYGIGISRLLGVLVEVFNDERGILWPMNIAPYRVHLINLGKSMQEAEKVYDTMVENNIDVLWDDREEVSAGEKFMEADLIGVPVRIVVSDKTLASQSVEMKMRNEKDVKLVKIKDIMKAVLAL